LVRKHDFKAKNEKKSPQSHFCMRTFGTKKAFFGGPAAFFSKQNEQKNRKSSFSRIFDRILSNLTILFGLKGSFCQGPDSSETAAFFGPEGAKSVALGSDFNKKRGAALGENVT